MSKKLSAQSTLIPKGGHVADRRHWDMNRRARPPPAIEPDTISLQLDSVFPAQGYSARPQTPFQTSSSNTNRNPMKTTVPSRKRTIFSSLKNKRIAINLQKSMLKLKLKTHLDRKSDLTQCWNKTNTRLKNTPTQREKTAEASLSPPKTTWSNKASVFCHVPRQVAA